MSHLIEHNAAEATKRSTIQGGGTWWRLPLLLSIVLVAIITTRSANQQLGDTKRRDQQPSRAAVEGKSVSLAIDFGDGRKREFDAIGWYPDMTVDDVMTAASRRPDGIRYTVSGDGQMTLLGSIDGVENQWGGGRFWLYRVNDKPADRSLAVYRLEPGDRVLWTFSDKE